jgi:hypothetical protein
MSSLNFKNKMEGYRCTLGVTLLHALELCRLIFHPRIETKVHEKTSS